MSSAQNSYIILLLDSSTLIWKRLIPCMKQGPTTAWCAGNGAVAVTQLFAMLPQVHPLWSCLHDPGHAQSAHPRETLRSLPQVFFLPEGLQVCRQHHGSCGQPAPSRVSQDYSVSILSFSHLLLHWVVPGFPLSLSFSLVLFSVLV